jgi:arylsulfatase A-like enzyme
MPDRPNVVLLLTDQQQAEALGAVDRTFRTPNLDALADRGTLFTGCHSTHPQCSPARSSLVTGQYPHQTGMYALPDWGPGPLDPTSPSVARRFRDAGYETAYVGKWHLGAGNVGALGWEVTANVHETANPLPGIPADTTTRDRAVEYLADYAGADPFFLAVSFNLPHPEFYEDPVFARWYDRDAVPLPESVGDDLADKPAFQAARARGPEGNLDEADARDVRYRYRTMVSRVDDHVGRVLDALEARGLREDTVVAFASDHGDMQGAHGLTKKGVLAYDEILRVPLIVDHPTRESRRERIPDLVSLASVPGTLLDAAGLSAEGFEGRSVLPAFERDTPPEGERVFFEHKYAYWGEHPYRGVRTRSWKYVEYLADGDDVDELYHAAADPHETTNLSGRAAHAEREARLREAVREWWERTDGDERRWRTPLGEL